MVGGLYSEIAPQQICFIRKSRCSKSALFGNRAAANLLLVARALAWLILLSTSMANLVARVLAYCLLEFVRCTSLASCRPGASSANEALLMSHCFLMSHC